MATKSKHVSLDAAFKFLLKEYGIPSKKEIDRLNAKIDRMEKYIKRSTAATGKTPAAKTTSTRASGSSRVSATNVVLDTIKRSKKGADFASLQAKTGFDEKKLRNIIFRLHKLGEIRRISRGVYEATEQQQ